MLLNDPTEYGFIYSIRHSTYLLDTENNLYTLNCDNGKWYLSTYWKPVHQHNVGWYPDMRDHGFNAEEFDNVIKNKRHLRELNNFLLIFNRKKIIDEFLLESI